MDARVGPATRPLTRSDGDATPHPTHTPPGHCGYRPPLADHTARAAAIDYAYIIEPERLRVLTNYAGSWQPVAEPAWTDHPDWDAIDKHAQHLRRGW